MPMRAAEAAPSGTMARRHGAMEYTEPPVDLDAVRLYRVGRVRAEKERRNSAAVLLFDQINTRYATDATNMQVWCSHYETRCTLVCADGPVVLFDYADDEHLAEGLPAVDEYRVMPAFYYFGAGSTAADKAGELAAQIADLMGRHGGGNRRLAVDRLSHLGVDAIRARGIEVVDGLPLIEHARAIKSAGEIALMRAAMAVCEAVMASMRDALRPGITELGAELLSSHPFEGVWLCGQRCPN